jgi:hypothetical protein
MPHHQLNEVDVAVKSPTKADGRLISVLWLAAAVLSDIPVRNLQRRREASTNRSEFGGRHRLTIRFLYS